MPADTISYLNRDEKSPMFSKLEREIRSSKQARAPASQWLGLIKGFTQKGVRALEISDSTIESWLQSKGSSSVTKDELLVELSRRTATIKEVQLGSPKFPGYRHHMGVYREHLYIANSELDNVVDEIDRVDYEMEQLSFDLERLADEPEVAVRLASERERLISMKGKSIDFAQHHFSDVVSGRMGKNLLAHVRSTLRDDGLYFIQEMQSDWAQRGRREIGGRSAFERGQVPEGPYVTDTEAWSGLVLRRHMQLAAQNPTATRLVWTRGYLRNGWVRDKDQEKDGLDDFYVKILPKIADKILKPAGARITFHKVTFPDGSEHDLPGVELTPQVRQVLADKKPLYSFGPLLRKPRSEDHPEAVAALRRAKEMLGSTKHIKLFNHVYEVATGRRVPGKYVNKMALVALDAADILQATDHECFHFASDNLLMSDERQMVHDAFRAGTELNGRVQRHLIELGQPDAARQCSNAEEAAAHGFALWRKGVLDLREEPPVRDIFDLVARAVRDCSRWIKRVVFAEQAVTPEDVFRQLAAGEFALDEINSEGISALAQLRPRG